MTSPWEAREATVWGRSHGFPFPEPPEGCGANVQRLLDTFSEGRFRLDRGSIQREIAIHLI